MGFAGFTQSQLDQLFGLFKERQSLSMVEKMTNKFLHTGHIQWGFDSGASHHMTSNYAAFSHVYNLSLPIIISQLDGQRSTMKQASMVKLEPDIQLKDVLYTLTFKYNLVFTQKLVIDENCVVSYGSNFCVTRDLTSKMLI